MHVEVMKLQRNYSLEYVHVVFIVETKGETVINVSYHKGGKITKCWLAETEGIFS